MQVAMHLARASARWPAGGARLGFIAQHAEDVRRRSEVRKAAAQAARECKHRLQRESLETHDWQQWRSSVRCRACWAVRGKTAASHPCTPERSKLQQLSVRAADCGHQLVLADFWAPGAVQPNGVLMFCGHCGAWSISGRSAKFKVHCAPPTAAGAQTLSRLQKGLFPSSGDQYKSMVLTDVLPTDPSILLRGDGSVPADLAAFA